MTPAAARPAEIDASVLCTMLPASVGACVSGGSAFGTSSQPSGDCIQSGPSLIDRGWPRQTSRAGVQRAAGESGASHAQSH